MKDDIDGGRSVCPVECYSCKVLDSCKDKPKDNTRRHATHRQHDTRHTHDTAYYTAE